MKILFVSATGAVGGAENVLLSIFEQFRESERSGECHLLSLSPGPLIERAAGLGVQTTILSAPAALRSFGDSGLRKPQNRALRVFNLAWRGISLSWSTWTYVRRLKRLVREIAPDLIHSNGIKTHALLWLAGIKETPLLWHVHDFLGRRQLARRILARAGRRAMGAIAISQAVAQGLRQLWPQLPVHVVANGVDTERFCPGQQDPELLDRLAGIAPQPCLRVGLVATYARWKGHTVFLNAAARMLRDRPQLPVRFYIIGGPIYQTQGSQFDRAELESLAQDLNIGRRIGFIDFQADVRPIYQALDIVVHASTAPEPFGLTIVEAMACGKPVIVAQGGGVSEIIRSGHDAISVAPGNDGALAVALATLLDDATLRSVLGKNARQTVCERFNRPRFGGQMLEIFDRFDQRRAVGSLALGPNTFGMGDSSILHPEHL